MSQERGRFPIQPGKIRRTARSSRRVRSEPTELSKGANSERMRRLIARWQQPRSGHG